MKINSFVGSIILLFIVFTIAFGQRSSSKQSTNANSTAFRSSQSEELSEDIIYERFFQYFAKYNDEADKQEQLGFGERAYALRAHFPRKLLLTEQQTHQLSDVVYQFHLEAIILKNQFKQLKALMKEQPQNPNLPIQINLLKNQRYLLWSKYRNSLREMFGNQAFQRFRTFLQQEIAAKVKRTRIVRQERENSVAESTADWIYTDSDIDYDPDTNTVYGHSDTVANDGGGTGGNYLYDFCGWEEETCTTVEVEAAMFDYEDFPIDSDSAQGCYGETEVFLYGSSEDFETGEYVIDGYHEANYTANSGSCSIEAPDFTDYSGDSISIVIPRVRILLNGSNITNTTQNVIVGQQISLTTDVTGGTPSNPQWTVPGTKVANYVVTYTNETSPSTAVVTELTSQNLTQSAINFYWVDGSDSRQVQYSVRINNRTYTGKATFNVKSPTVTVTTQTNTTTIYTKSQHQELLFGEIGRLGGGKFGITFTKSDFQVPAGFSGDTVWVQVIDYAFTITLSDEETTKTASGIGLDSRFPYSANDPNADLTRDLPGVCLRICDSNLPSFIKMQTRINADMWLMFKPKNLPNGVNSIYIPLKKVSWNWTATATRRPDFLFDLTSANNSQNPASENTTSFPQWSKIVTGKEPYQ